MDRKLRIEELGRVDVAGYKAQEKRPITVVLDDVRSRHNVGSIFRTADAFGLERLMLCGFTPCPPHREIEKTALGATLSVPWEHAPAAELAVRRLKEEGYRVYAVEQTVQAVDLGAWRPWPEERPAFVFGNELAGVSEAVIGLVDGSIVIPQHGVKHSMNVAVSAGIVLWHACSVLKDRVPRGGNSRADVRSS